MLDDKNDTMEDLKSQADYFKSINDYLLEKCNKSAKKIADSN